MANLQTVSIIAAFPIGIVMILIIASFIKDAKKYQDELVSEGDIKPVKAEGESPDKTAGNKKKVKSKD